MRVASWLTSATYLDDGVDIHSTDKVCRISIDYPIEGIDIIPCTKYEWLYIIAQSCFRMVDSDDRSPFA